MAQKKMDSDAFRISKQWHDVEESLHSQFRFKELRPGQEQIIRAVLAGKNTLAIMPTGAGKSLCYQLPALQLRGTTIVVSPLISLMKDQREKVEQKGISAVELNSSLNSAETHRNLGMISSDLAEIIYVTPERFSQTEFLNDMDHHQIDFVVLDEAHCISQWGHDFRPAYLMMRESLKKMGNPPVLALTATATEEVAADIQKQLGLKHMEVFRSSILRPNLQFEVRYLNTPQEKLEALYALVREMKDTSGIIYTATVKAAQEIHDFLISKDVPSILYHGKLKAKEREENQNEFMNHSPRLMIATNAFGMGIDKADIRFVIHFQFPASLEAYYQEAGRAGRDGEKARCILLYLKRDKCTQSLFLSGKYPRPEEVAQVYAAFQVNDKDPLPQHQFHDALSTSLGKKKASIILSLLKQLEVLKSSKKNGWGLVKKDLTETEVAELAKFYQVRQKRDHAKLNEVIKYAQSALCRWRTILHYFNEPTEKEVCEHCDNCLVPERRNLARLL